MNNLCEGQGHCSLDNVLYAVLWEQMFICLSSVLIIHICTQGSPQEKLKKLGGCGVCDHINHLDYHVKGKLVLKTWGGYYAERAWGRTLGHV